MQRYHGVQLVNKWVVFWFFHLLQSYLVLSLAASDVTPLKLPHLVLDLRAILLKRGYLIESLSDLTLNASGYVGIRSNNVVWISSDNINGNFLLVTLCSGDLVINLCRSYGLSFLLSITFCCMVQCWFDGARMCSDYSKKVYESRHLNVQCLILSK